MHCELNTANKKHTTKHIHFCQQFISIKFIALVENRKNKLWNKLMVWITWYLQHYA